MIICPRFIAPAPSANEGRRALPTADTIKSGSYYRVRGHVIVLTSVGKNEWDTLIRPWCLNYTYRASDTVLTSLGMVPTVSQYLSFPLQHLTNLMAVTLMSLCNKLPD